MSRPVTPTRRALGLGAAVVTATAVAVIVPSTSAAAATPDAVVRSAHFSPDTAGVDVYLAPLSGGQTQLWVSNEEYGSISAYRHITPGVYAVSMRLHGAPATSAPVITWTLNAQSGAAYTAAAVGMNSALRSVILDDNLTPPAANTGRVRVVQAASQASTVSVIANGGVSLANNLAFGTASGYTSVPVGTWTVRATPAGGSVAPADGQVAVSPGSSSTIAVLSKAGGGINIVSVEDSASAGVAPSGSVDAGGGGTATQFASDRTPASSDEAWLWLIGGGLVVVTGGAVVAVRRRQQRQA